MKKSYLLLLILIVPIFTKGQDAVIHFDVKNTSTKEILILNDDFTNAKVMFGERVIKLPLFDGKASHTFKLSKSIFVLIYYRADSTKNYSRYNFYLSPGDSLYFSVDTNNPEASCRVIGKGSENNQPLIQQVNNYNLKLDDYKKDTLPDNVFKYIKEQHTIKDKILSNYIDTYSPTNEFTKIHLLSIQYFSLIEYIKFKGSQKFYIRESFFRNENRWQAIEDSLSNVISIGNDELLNNPNYVYFLSTYLTRIKERLWKHPELLQEYFSDDEAAVIMKEDPENLPMERIINKHFIGKSAEILYAVLFKDAINETEDNLPEIFARFKQQYPNSKYILYIEPDILKIVERRNRKLTSKMILIENPESIQTFENVLKLVKGKTVLLDMWGTWCGPCRSELLQNSDSIKNYFKSKELDYLYIANHDLGKEDKWKELIAYYNLTGTHILANENLTRDIMTKVNGDGYPTYVIIKKDGTFELSKAGYPMDRNVLYKQLDEALNY